MTFKDRFPGRGLGVSSGVCGLGPSNATSLPVFGVCVCVCVCVCAFSPKVDFTKFADRIQSFTDTQG